MLTSNKAIQRQLHFWRLPALLCALVIGIIGMHGLALHGSTAGSSHGVHGAVMDVSGDHAGTLTSVTTEPDRATPGPDDHSGVMALCMAMFAGAAFTMLLLFPRRRSLLWFVRSASSKLVLSTPLSLFQHRLFQGWPVWRFTVVRS